MGGLNDHGWWPELKELLPRKETVSSFMGPAGHEERPPPIDLTEIQLGTFDNAELLNALKILNLPPDFVQSLSVDAQVLAKRPRYLSLLKEHRLRLGEYAAVTAEVLHWLDLSDKVGRMRAGLEDWSPQQNQLFLRELAKHWLDQKFLDEFGVRQILTHLTDDVPRVVADLQSEGVLSGESGSYTVEPSRLTFGYGLFLRDALLMAYRQKQNLEEALSSLLAPLVEGDEAVAALRAASTLMLIEVEAKRATTEKKFSPDNEILDVLLRSWLDSRNLRHQDLEAIDELRRLLFEPLLRSWQEVWMEERRNSRRREIAIMVFGEAAETKGAARDRLRKVVQEWFRLVPVEGGWYQREKFKHELKLESEATVAEAIESHLRRQVALPNLSHLGLQVVEQLDVLGLQTAGLYLVSRDPYLVDPENVLALIVVRLMLEEPIDSGGLWSIRRALEEARADWFREEAIRCVKSPDQLIARSIYELFRIADRADLGEVKELLRPIAEAPKQKRLSHRWPTKRNYKALLLRALRSPLETLRFAKSVGSLVRNPALPLPTGTQRRALAQAVQIIFSTEIATGDDALDDINDLLPALAVWAPEIGAQLIERFLRGIPDRIRQETMRSAQELRGHAALARGELRDSLLRALRLSRARHKERQRAIEQREITLALLPAATPAETIALLVNEETRWEHKETFKLAGALCTSAERQLLVDVLRSTKSRGRKRRLRFLLGYTKGSPLPATEVTAISQTLRKREARDIAAALQLAAECSTNLDRELLLPIARGEVANKTYAQDLASFILVNRYEHEEIKDHLDDYWRAKSAARRHESAHAFLDGVSVQLSHDNSASRGAINHDWERYDLPAAILPFLDAERVAKWTRAFNSWDGVGWRRWGGLIRPTFDWCLRNGADDHAKVLWPQIYPFQRRRFGGGSSLTIDGVDSVLHALNRRESDDRLTRSFLYEMILDARTDFEIFQIALGACFQGVDRLQAVAQELRSEAQAERRVRAVAILGWLGEGRDTLKFLESRDPSVWVREQAKISLGRHASASWARSWLEKFLSAKRAVDRWAAGRMFLECADQRFDCWAWKRVQEGGFGRRLKGEAFLLLHAGQERAKSEAEKLQKTLLGYNVGELATTAHPWRRDDEWILSHYGRKD